MAKSNISPFEKFIYDQLEKRENQKEKDKKTNAEKKEEALKKLDESDSYIVFAFREMANGDTETTISLKCGKEHMIIAIDYMIPKVSGLD